MVRLHIYVFKLKRVVRTTYMYIHVQYCTVCAVHWLLACMAGHEVSQAVLGRRTVGDICIPVRLTAFQLPLPAAQEHQAEPASWAGTERSPSTVGDDWPGGIIASLDPDRVLNHQGGSQRPFLEGAPLCCPRLRCPRLRCRVCRYTAAHRRTGLQAVVDRRAPQA